MFIYDVIVAGAGPAGLCAAVAAARQGARVALVERYGVVGGNLTAGYVGPILGMVGKGTMRDELVRLLGVPENDMIGETGKAHDVERAKLLLARWVNHENIDVYLQSTVAGVHKDGNRVTGLSIATQEGLLDLKGSVVIDATGDAVVSFLAGAHIEKGREDGLMQPVTLEFTIDGVDERTGLICIGDVDNVQLNGIRFLDWCKQRADEGKLPQKLAAVRLHPTVHPGQRQVNTTQVNGVDITRVEQVFKADLELREQMFLLEGFLRENVPGYEHIRIVSSGTTTGVRESRRVMGDYVITAEELAAGCRFPDVVVHRGPYPILPTVRPPLPLLPSRRTGGPAGHGTLHFRHPPRPRLVPGHVHLHGHGRSHRHRRRPRRPEGLHAASAGCQGTSRCYDQPGNRPFR